VFLIKLRIKNKAFYNVLLVILAIIVISITLVEFSDILTDRTRYILFLINIFILSIFMIDFGFRLKKTTNKKAFFKEPLHIFDFIAILPYELLVFAPGLTAIRALRASLRLLRFFRVIVFIRKIYISIKKFFLNIGFIK